MTERKTKRKRIGGVDIDFYAVYFCRDCRFFAMCKNPNCCHDHDHGACHVNPPTLTTTQVGNEGPITYTQTQPMTTEPDCPACREFKPRTP